MKKILAILLCIVTAFTMSLTAFAATELDESPATGKTDGDYSIGVTGKYVEGEEAEKEICVDITWDDMRFTYTEGTSKYNPNTHQIGTTPGGWEDAKRAITLINHSNVDINAGFDFTQADGISATGTFYSYTDGSYVSLSADEQFLTLESGEDTTEDGVGYVTPMGTMYFGVSGSGVAGSQKLGTITVTLSSDDDTVVVKNADALYEALEAGKSVKLGSSFDLTLTSGADFDLNSDVTRELDLNGQTLTGKICIRGGTLTVKDSVGTGKIQESKNDVAVSATDNATLNIEGGTVTSIDVSHGGAANISGGTVGDGTYFAAVVYANSTLTVTGGTLVGDVQGALFVTGNADISGGEINGKLVSNTGTFTVTGGTFDNDPSEFVDTDSYTVTLTDGKYTVTAKESGEVTVNDADALYEALEAGKDVKLGSSFELKLTGSEDFEIYNDVTRTLDLNGQTLTGKIWIRGGTLTVKDSAGTGEIVNEEGSNFSSLDVNEGATLNVEGGSFAGIVASSGAVVNLSGGNISGNDTITIYGNAKLIVTGGTIIAGNYAVYCRGTAEISGGDFTGTLYSDDGTLTVTGGTFDNDPSEFVDTDNYTVTENDGKYTVTAKESGEVTVNDADALYEALEAGKDVKLGSSFELKRTGGEDFTLYSTTERTLDLNGQTLTGMIDIIHGTFDVTDNVGTGKMLPPSDNNVVFGLYNADAVLNINGGTFSGIRANNGVVNISGGTVNGVDSAVTIFGNAKLVVTAGTFTNGSDSRVVYNTGTVEISGGDFTGTLYNDNGTLTVTGGTFDNDPSEFVDTDNYKVTESDGKYTVTSKTVTVNDADALKQALEAGGDVILGSSFELTLTSGNDFDLYGTAARTLDLNGYTLTGKIYLYGGTLTVKDSVGTGAIVPAEGGDGHSFSTNESTTLNIEGGTFEDISLQGGTVNMSGGSTGTIVTVQGAVFNMNGGTVAQPEDAWCALNNSGSAYISGGTVNGEINVYNGTLTVTGGTFDNDPSEFVDTDNYKVTESDGMYTVTSKD